MKNLDTFVESKTPMQKARINEILNKKRNYPEGIRTEKEYIENAVKEGKEFVEKTIPKKHILLLRYEGKPKQFDYLLKNEGAKQNQYGDFVKGNYNTPLTLYLASGDVSQLPSKYVDKEYYINCGETATVISKTGFDYAKYLQE